MTVSEALRKSPNIIVLTKSSQFNKPEGKRLRTDSYQLREAIIEFFNWHAPDCCLEGDDVDSNVVLEISGCDEFFLDLSKPVTTLMQCMEEHSLDTNRKVIIECKGFLNYKINLAKFIEC